MRKLFLVALFFLIASFSFAEFNVGVKVGYNASKLSTSVDTLTSNFNSGFQGGVFVRIGKRFYLQPELYYTTQGGVYSSNLSTWQQTIKLGSLDVPALVGLKLINNNNLNLRLLAGPLVSFIVSKSISEAGGVLNPITNADISTVNWYIQAGAGIDVWKFTLDVRYQIGLNQIIKEVQNVNYNARNNVWVVSLGFKIL